MSLGLYTHFPWCVRKCPYCDFNSHPVRGELDETSYVSRLIEDFKKEFDSTRENINTIYLGGGTPSLFSAKAVGRFLESVDRQNISEITGHPVAPKVCEKPPARSVGACGGH